MTTTTPKHLFCLALLGAAALMSTGCASFRGNQLANLGPIDKQPAPVLQKARLDFRLSQNGKTAEGICAKTAIDVHKKIAREAIQESGLIGEFRPVTSGADTVPGEYVLKYEMNNWGNKGAAVASGVICGLSLLAIPGFATDHFTLKGDLIDPQGRTVWSGNYEDKLTTVIWIGFFPRVLAPPLYPNNAVKATLKNMYHHSFDEIAKANLGQPIVNTEHAGAGLARR